MEERTGSGFPTAGTSPSGTSGLSTLEATERSDVHEHAGFREQASTKARDFASEGKEKARRLGAMAKERAVKKAESRKSHLASELDNFAGTLEEVSRTLESRGDETQKKLVDRGAKLVRQASRQLRERSTEEILDAAERELKRRPGIAMAGAFALGFLGLRMLRS
jgi:hypothetical protein